MTRSHYRKQFRWKVIEVTRDFIQLLIFFFSFKWFAARDTTHCSVFGNPLSWKILDWNCCITYRSLVSFLFFRFTRIFKLKVDEKIALKCKIETGSYDDQVQKLHISAWGNFFTFFRLASPCHVPTDPRTVSNFYQIWSQHATLLLCDTRIYSGTITFVRPITSDIIQCSWLISQCLDQ